MFGKTLFAVRIESGMPVAGDVDCLKMLHNV